MSGFGKKAGPTPTSLSQPRFGPPPSSPHTPPSEPFPSFPPRGSEAPQTVRPPPFGYQSSGLAPRGHQPNVISRRPEVLERVRPPPMGSESLRPVGSPAYSAAGSHKWVNGQSAQPNPRPSAVTSFVAARNSGTSTTAKTLQISRFQDSNRIRSPALHSTVKEISGNQTFFESSPSDFPIGNGNQFGPSRTSIQHFQPPLDEGQWQALAPSARNSRPRFSENRSNYTARHEQSPVIESTGFHDSGNLLMNEIVDIHAPKRNRSPPRSSAGEVVENAHSRRFLRPSVSPPRLGTRSNALFNASDSQVSQRPLPSVPAAAQDAPTRTTGFSVAKRTRSPPLPSTDRISQEISYSSQDGAEREMQAKARRLARFKEELNHNSDVENTPGDVDQKVAASRHEQSVAERQTISGGRPMGSAVDVTNANPSSDFEGLETSSVIIGLCPDMCPESERAERERKGDLDQYERLDGDRNQTNKFLAVKKYTRTAEREANLIRPMPILQKTVDYLLNLLDQPYDDRFLGMYNFLWDRMRAIRMDLRMQHIFNLEAITMLEQMIRLHIIAMHELCEYTKGEGFSEGFDAHLNIEQMNKTSVELFQMYDDHRKRGINVPTEQEFRGYYALLKLDKHPGYKVEPAELSLDLAKMTPEIRQTPEVLFARRVARACRTSNFIVFFRLARKATYLQACLIHAHFAKLRTHALASLHSGLQSGQGMPIAQVAQWLAMEEEEIEDLIEYHGFLIKEFEEPYMVKEGPFLNSGKDYPTKCSKLVHQKKLSTIVGDVSPTCSVVPLSTEATKEQELPKIYKHETKAAPSAFVDKIMATPEINTPFVGKVNSVQETDEEMSDIGTASSPKVSTQMQSKKEKSIVNHLPQDEPPVFGAYTPPWSFSLQQSFADSQPVKFDVVEKQNLGDLGTSAERRTLSGMESSSPRRISRVFSPVRSPSGKYGNTMENANSHIVVSGSAKAEETNLTPPEENNVIEDYNEEVAQAKLKLIVRLWRRHTLKLKELREQRQIAASAALNSLSLGPPIRQSNDQPSTASGFDIDHVMRERYEKYKESWSKLNVSDVISDVLVRRSPHTSFFCWKIILCTQFNDQEDKREQRTQVAQVAASQWLISKLMPGGKDDGSDDDILISSSSLAMWKQWVPSPSVNNPICCLSVVRDVHFDDSNEAITGASAVLFLVSESIPWNLQKTQLHNLLMSIPSGSSLPLLVLSDSYCREDSDSASVIESELGLNDIDKSRISRFLIVFLVGDKQMEHLDGFFSDMQLREGIRWLARESPLQPDLQCIKTRDLVLFHLNPAMDALERMSDYEVRPSHCITAFNEALDLSIGKIDAAAKANSTSWPCPEIDLLEGLCDEYMVAKWHLPSTGWSSASSTEPLLCAIRDCKLPSFPYGMSWLGKGANTGSEVEDLRSELENCLGKYLSQASRMMGSLLAAKEAHLMLQRSARLELHDSSYYIVPKWVMVFRRIFNWRLTSLLSGPYCSAYILRADHVCSDLQVMHGLDFEGNGALLYLNQPCLDEVIDAECGPLLLRSSQPEQEAFQPPSRVVLDGDFSTAANANDPVESESGLESGKAGDLMENGRALDRGRLLDAEKFDSMTNGVNTNTSIVVSSSKEVSDNDRLSRLLEQCNLVQNSIEQKLSIYF